jgi:two-component system sensor histidine kinase AlgZ
LDYTIQVAEGLGAFPMPSLVLQTLVENAVKHGIAPYLEGGRIDLRIVHEPLDSNMQAIRISLVNSGLPLKQPVVLGTGLRNTMQRLQVLYGSKAGFEIRAQNDGSTVVSFCCCKDSCHEP